MHYNLNESHFGLLSDGDAQKLYYSYLFIVTLESKINDFLNNVKLIDELHEISINEK